MDSNNNVTNVQDVTVAGVGKVALGVSNFFGRDNNMKHLLTGLLFVFAALPLQAAVVGTVLEAAGDVRNAAGATVRSGGVVDSGDTFSTGAGSRLRIRFADGQVLLLQSGSKLKVADYQFDSASGSGRSFLELLQGGLRAVTGLIGKRDPKDYAIKARTATIGIRGTAFNLVLADNVLVEVTQGQVILSNSLGDVLASAGQVAGAATNGVPALLGSGQFPAGVFNELNQAAAAGGVSSAATGAAPAGAGAAAVTPAMAAGIAVGVAAVAAAVSDSSTTSHHATTSH